MPGSIIRGAAVALALFAAGCSATSYKPAVDTFATATGRASVAYAALQGQVLAAHTESLKARVQQRALLPQFADGECSSTSARCRLEVLGRDGRTEWLLPELTNIVALLDGIATYAGNLQAIVNSEAPGQVGTNLAGTAASLKALGDELTSQKVGGQLGPDLSTFAVPSGNIVAWFAGEYLNLLQLNALRDATRMGEPVIHEATALLARLAKLATIAARQDQADQLTAQLAAFDRSRGDRGKLDALAAAVADFDKVLVATNPDVFTAMGTAHTDLTRSLHAQGVTLAQAYAAVQDFAKRAEALHTAIDALVKARKDAKAAAK